jgi:hypothetical protein
VKVDGRRKATVPVVLAPDPRMTTPSNALVSSIISQFDKSGSSNHSKLRGTLCYIIDHCERKGIGYELQAAPGSGYLIRKRDWLAEGLVLNKDKFK